MNDRVLWRGVAVCAAFALAPSTGGQSTEGVKQIERLVKASGSTVQAISETKLQLQTTLDAYNASRRSSG